MHAIWSHLLDEEFMNAYVHRMLVKCVDGTVRQFFPQIFTYSADYPEKYVFVMIFTTFPFFFCHITMGNLTHTYLPYMSR